MAKSESIKKSLKEWHNDYENDTAKISEIIRSLALGGIGVIWIFRNADLNQKILPAVLIFPIVMLVSALSLDFIHYIWRALNTFVFYKINERRYEKEKIKDIDIEDIGIRNYVPVVSWILFIAKIVCVLIAYFQIFQFLIPKIWIFSNA